MNSDFTNEDFKRAVSNSEEWAPFQHSEGLDKFATALARAQLSMTAATKSTDNDFFHSKYADLAAVQKACMTALNENGIAVIQSPSKDNAKVVLTTMLVHSSGQWMKGQLTLSPAKSNNLQSDGGAITYARRYSLAAMVGVAQEDDDGNEASGAQPRQERKPVDRSAAAKKAAETRAKNAAKPPWEQAVDAFTKKLGLGQAWVENVLLGCAAKDATPEQIEYLRGTYTDLANIKKKSDEAAYQLAVEALAERAAIQAEAAQ